MPAGRPKKGTPKLSSQEQRLRQVEAKFRNWLRRRHIKTARQREHAARMRQLDKRLTHKRFAALFGGDGLRVVAQVQITRPVLRWIGPSGRIETEHELSAEELIAAWKASTEK